MARSNGRRGGGDRVLESRHLVGLFLGVVLLCAVFFTLGYVMGRTQYGAPVHAAGSFDHGAPLPLSPAAKPKDKDKIHDAQNPAAPAPGEWDFYTRKDNTHLGPSATNESPAALPKPLPVSAPAASSKAPATGPAPASSAKPADTNAQPSQPAAITPARFAPPKSAKGTIVLQIAAFKRESDALSMADILQRKKFPSFVVAPASDPLYRVQVGPYPNAHAAQIAQSALKRDGFKALLKR
jgi:DedD protein